MVDTEWKMFQNVPNIGGPSSCQQDSNTFKIMRYSQAISWSEDALESYLNDLTEAETNGRNLFTEKYARMMESTSPLEYGQIEHLLPKLNSDVSPLIDEIVGIVLEWEEELFGRYPFILKRGRPIHSSEDTLMETSVETYLRGELATYSYMTLHLYREHILQQKAKGTNGSRITLCYTLRQYGFKSLEEANERLKA